MSKSDKASSPESFGDAPQSQLATAPPHVEKPKTDLTGAALLYLLDQNMRSHLANGRRSKAKAVENIIHGLGGKTVSEQEAEAEEKRLAAIKATSPTEENPLDSD